MKTFWDLRWGGRVEVRVGTGCVEVMRYVSRRKRRRRVMKRGLGWRNFRRKERGRKESMVVVRGGGGGGGLVAVDDEDSGVKVGPCHVRLRLRNGKCPLDWWSDALKYRGRAR